MKLLIFCLILLMLSSCKREPLTFDFEGVVNDLTFDTPLTSGKIELYKFAAGSTFGQFVESYELSTEATYNFTIERDESEKYELHFVSNRYFNEKISIPFSALKPNEVNTFNFDVYAMSFVKFVIRNENSPSQNDKFKFLKQGGKTNCDECCPDGYTYYSGVVNEELFCANNGNTTMTYYYWLNGNEKHGNETITSPAFDTLIVDLTY